jgi:hypothetical protein
MDDYGERKLSNFQRSQWLYEPTDKECLNMTVAGWVDQLSRLQFDSIGSLYCEWNPTADNYLEFKLGPVAADYFLGPWRMERQAFQGPF